MVKRAQQFQLVVTQIGAQVRRIHFSTPPAPRYAVPCQSVMRLTVGDRESSAKLGYPYGRTLGGMWPIRDGRWQGVFDVALSTMREHTRLVDADGNLAKNKNGGAAFSYGEARRYLDELPDRGAHRPD